MDLSTAWTLTNTGTITLTNASVALVDSGSDIDNFGTFKGDGTVENGNNGDFNFQPGSTVAPGTSIGKLTFRDNIDFEMDFEEVVKFFDFPVKTIQGRLSELQRDGFLVAVISKRKGRRRFRKWYSYNVEGFWIKILKTGGSEKHDTDIVASTWEKKERPKRFEELKKAILDFGNLFSLKVGDLGYSRTEEKSEPVEIPEFPEIEVHTE